MSSWNRRQFIYFLHYDWFNAFNACKNIFFLFCQVLVVRVPCNGSLDGTMWIHVLLRRKVIQEQHLRCLNIAKVLADFFRQRTIKLTSISIALNIGWMSRGWFELIRRRGLGTGQRPSMYVLECSSNNGMRYKRTSCELHFCSFDWDWAVAR